MLFALCALLLALPAPRSTLLTALAHAYMVEDPIEKADAILVMGGGLQYRTFEAAELYNKGYASHILIAQAKPSPTDELGLTIREKELMKQVLVKKGVPENAITEVGHNVRSSYEEALAVREWMSSNHASRVIVPTDIFHTRRARWLFRKELKPVNGHVLIRAITPREYCATDWWQHEEGLIAFQNDLIKFGFYILKY